MYDHAAKLLYDIRVGPDHLNLCAVMLCGLLRGMPDLRRPMLAGAHKRSLVTH